MKKALLILSYLIFISLLNAQTPSVCLLPRVDYSVGVNPNSITSADFNNDGKYDIVSANYGSSNISILLANNSGGFMNAVNYSTGSYPISVTSGDFNNDGNVDIASANNGTGNVSILLGNGVGVFSAAVNFSTGIGPPTSIVSADFNGDGKIDLAVTNGGSSKISILIGSGLGTFSATVNYTLSSSSTPLLIISSDFNNDGFADIATANASSNSISVLLGNGMGIFSNAINYLVGMGQISITAADFNGDNKVDIAAVGSSSVSILIGNGIGAFTNTVNYSVSTNLWSVVSADFNLDGITDIATGNHDSNNISILTGTGTGSFPIISSFGVGSGPACIISADFNGDSKIDIASANFNSNNVSVFFNGIPKIVLPSNNSLCFGSSLNINALGANTYTWNTGASTTSINVSPTTNTSYTVIGMATNGCTNTAVSSVTVNPNPIVSVSRVPGNAICHNQNGSFIDSYNGQANFGHQWSISGLVISGATSGSLNVGPGTGNINNGSYNVVVTDLLTGCFGTSISSAFSMMPIPSASIQALSSATFCAGGSVMLQALQNTSGPLYTYIWSTGATAQSINVTAGGIQTYTATGSNGCSNTASLNVVVNPLPTIIVNSGAICSGKSFTMTPNGAMTYTYSSTTNIVSPVSSTDYTVTGTGVNSCSNSAVSSVTVNSIPIISVNSGSICSGQSFTMMPSGASTYTYSSSSAVVSPTTNTIYSVTGMNLQGCFSNGVLSTVSVYALPVLTTSTSNTLLCSGHTSTLSVSGATSYTWISNSNTPTIAISPSVTTSYTVEGIDINGCVSSSTITQSVSLCTGMNNVTFNNLTITTYPNPVGDFLNIQYNEINNNEVTIQLVNTLGQILIEEKTKSEYVTLNLTNTKNGIYFIKVSVNEKLIALKKIVKQ